TSPGKELRMGVWNSPVPCPADGEGFPPAIQVFAKLFGKIMPFWMVGTALLHLVLLAVTWNWPAISTVLLLVATLLWLIICIFSVVGPVPINNRVKAW